MVPAVSADDFHSRRGASARDGALRLENFRVTQLTTGDDDTVGDRPVAAVSEGPHGVYRFRLAPSESRPQLRPVADNGHGWPWLTMPENACPSAVAGYRLVTDAGRATNLGRILGGPDHESSRGSG